MNTKHLHLKKIKIGEVCTTEAGNRGLFLGYVNTDTMMVDVASGVEKSFWYEKDRKKLLHMDIDFGVRYRRKHFVSLWLDLRDPYQDYVFGKREDIENFFDDSIKRKFASRFHVKQSYNYSLKVIMPPIEVPTEIILNVRNLANRKALDIVERNRFHRTNGELRTDNKFDGFVPMDKLRHYDAFLIRQYAPLANMVPFGMKPIRSEACHLFDLWTTNKNKFKHEQI